MTNYRYMRMAGNDHGWRRPHGGRQGGDDFVGTQGFGYEDWNFAHDIWEDGNYHLYLKTPPANFQKTKFNFVLGVHAQPVPYIIGFAENVTFGLSRLPDQVLMRRAREIHALNQDDSLGPLYKNLDATSVAKTLANTSEKFCICVEPGNLHILENPVPVPAEFYKVSHPGYRPLKMEAEQYDALKRLTLSDEIVAVHQQEDFSFPEGAVVERFHRSHERNRQLTELAKRNYIAKHSSLFCEACGLDPVKHFGSDAFAGKVIQAHHDIPLSDASHGGITKVSDLRMLCPTCHSAIHSTRPWLTVSQLKELLQKV